MNEFSNIPGARSLGGTAVVIPPPAMLSIHNPDLAVLGDNGVVALGNGADIRALHMLRAQVLKRAHGRGFNLIGVTSVEPEAGKSFVTANLAAALSRISGQDVVLLDLDLKRPAIARRFGIDTDLGIESWLSGEVDNLAALGRRSIRYACVMTCEGREVATGSLTIACVTRGADGVMQAAPIPDAIASRFAVAPDAA